jgi:hypothetical protein
MKKFFLLFFIPFISQAFGQETFTAGYKSDSIVIDGKANEWPIPFRFSDYQSKIVYNIKNDDEYLYFCFKTDYRMTAMKMMRLGFDISIDTSGKKKKDWHLQFPMRNAPDHKPEEARNDMRGSDFRQMQLRMKSEVNALLAEGFIGLPNQVLPLANTNDIKAAVDFDKESAFVVELAIPLKYIQVGYASSKKPWTITLKMNAPPAPISTLGGNGGMGNTDRKGGLNPNSINGMNNGIGNGMGNGSMNSGNGVGSMQNPDMQQAGAYGNNEFDEQDAQQHGVRDPSFYESSEWRFKLLLGAKEK